MQFGSLFLLLFSSISISFAATKAEIKTWLDVKDGIMPGQVDSIQYTETDPWVLFHGDINQNDGQQVRLYRNQTAISFNGTRTINQNQWIKIEGFLECGRDDFEVSGIGVGNIIASCSLPITYSNPLEVTKKQNSTKLSWSVATQINNDKYIIEHSTDGKDFLSIGEIYGDGTNNEERHYEYTHKTPSLGISYYRIKQVDYDGTSSYSNIASAVNNSDGLEIVIYPNPATDNVTVSGTEATELSVTDMMGRVLKKVTIGKDQNTVNLSEFPSGMLIFVIADQRYRVLKE